MIKRFAIGKTAIDPEDNLYIIRPEDELLFLRLSNGSHCNLHSSRQAGKTSLIYRTMRRLEESGSICVDIDMTQLGAERTLRSWILGIAESIRGVLYDFCPWTNPPGDNSEALVTLLEHLSEYPSEGTIYLFIDELDYLNILSKPEIAAFFLGLRHFINSQAKVKIRKRLRLTLVSILTPDEFLQDHSTGGISVSSLLDIRLPFFQATPEIVTQILDGFEKERHREIELLIPEIIRLTGGQPLLTSYILAELQSADHPGQLLEKLNTQLLRGGTPVDGHFEGIKRQLLSYGSKFTMMINAYQRIRSGENSKQSYSSDTLAVLENIGLIQVGSEEITISNPIYQKRFDQKWIHDIKEAYNTLSLNNRFNIRKKGFQERRRVAVILTGGTIGMVVDDNGQARFPEDISILKDEIQEKVDPVAEAEVISLDQKDGINMTPADWSIIAEEIYRRKDSYDGFVIAHGTDTLAYSASAVGFALGPQLNFPVVFTGAQTTVNLPHGDTMSNLIRACFVAGQPKSEDPQKNTRIEEVMICFDDLVLRACRSQKEDDRRYSGFSSPGWPPLGRITEEFLINRNALAPMNRIKTGPPLLKNFFKDTILYLHLVPGLRRGFFEKVLEEQIESSNKVDGIILSSPGVGNIPSIREYNFIPLIEKATALKIPVLITSQVPINPDIGAQYERATAPIEAGAIHAGDLTTAAAMTKFSWIIGVVEQEVNAGSDLNKWEEIKKRMQVDYIGELRPFE